MNLADVDKLILDPGLSLLPDKYDSLAARAMLMAIGLQESNFTTRLQVKGPARGFWQFERAGISGVMRHHETTDTIAYVSELLHIPATVEACYDAVGCNDTLACVFARLLLWTEPYSLPGPNESGRGYSQYIRTWRPGRPRPEKWQRNFTSAWDFLGNKG